MKENITKKWMLALFLVLICTGIMAGDVWMVNNPHDSENEAGTLRSAILGAKDGDLILINTKIAKTKLKIEVSQKRLTIAGMIYGDQWPEVPSLSKFDFLQKGAEIKFENLKIALNDHLWNSSDYLEFKNCKFLFYDPCPQYDTSNDVLICAKRGGTIDFSGCVFSYNKEKKVTVSAALCAIGRGSRITMKDDCILYPKTICAGKRYIDLGLRAIDNGTIDIKEGTECHYKKGSLIEVRNDSTNYTGPTDAGTIKSNLEFVEVYT